MMKHDSQPIQSPTHDLLFLETDQVKRIDQVLAELGEFGEVRLIKIKGKLRFIQKVTSEEIPPG